MNKKRLIPGIITIIVALFAIVFTSVPIFDGYSIFTYLKSMGNWYMTIAIAGYFVYALLIQNSLFLLFVDKPDYQRRVDIQSIIFFVLTLGLFTASLVVVLVNI